MQYLEREPPNAKEVTPGQDTHQYEEAHLLLGVQRRVSVYGLPYILTPCLEAHIAPNVRWTEGESVHP